MKRVFFLNFLWALCLTAPIWGEAKAPWGIFKDIPEENTFSIYAVDNLIDKRPIRYAVSQDVTPQEEKIFKENILKWPQETLRFIQKSGRAQEFQDIVPVLRHKLPLLKVSEQDSPDIVLRFTDTLYNANGDFIGKGGDSMPFNQIRIHKEYRDIFAITSLHELGHYFGLGDQYENSRGNVHAEYSSDVNVRDGAVMNDNAVLTCDDLDGFINLIDLRLAQRAGGRFSARARKGWKSLCPKSKNIYQNALTTTREQTDTLWIPIYTVEIVYHREYEQGKLQRQLELILGSPIEIFAIPSDATVERDSNTQLIQVIRTHMTQTEGNTPSGDVPYERSFTYAKASPVRGNETVKISISEKLDGKEFRSYTLFASSDGNLVGLPDTRLTNSAYHTYGKGMAIHFSFKDGFLRPSGTYFDVKNEYNDLALAGNYDEDAAEVIRRGQRQHVELPPSVDDNELYLTWGLMELNMQALISYRTNFYNPLFGAEAAQAQQVRNKIKQALENLH